MIDEKKLLEDFEKVTFADETEKKMYRDLLNYLIGLQEKVSDWIPCSERLPDKEGKYLVILRKFNTITFADFKDMKNNPHFNAPVIAWQALPIPYKEE